MARTIALLLLLAVSIVFAAPVPESLTLAQTKGIVAACFNFVRNSPDPIQSAGKITVAIVDNAGQLKAFVSDGEPCHVIFLVFLPCLLQMAQLVEG
jgi:hypothetical protein